MSITDLEHVPYVLSGRGEGEHRRSRTRPVRAVGAGLSEQVESESGLKEERQGAMWLSQEEPQDRGSSQCEGPEAGARLHRKSKAVGAVVQGVRVRGASGCVLAGWPRCRASSRRAGEGPAGRRQGDWQGGAVVGEVTAARTEWAARRRGGWPDSGRRRGLRCPTWEPPASGGS